MGDELLVARGHRGELVLDLGLAAPTERWAADQPDANPLRDGPALVLGRRQRRIAQRRGDASSQAGVARRVGEPVDAQFDVAGGDGLGVVEREVDAVPDGRAGRSWAAAGKHRAGLTGGQGWPLPYRSPAQMGPDRPGTGRPLFLGERFGVLATGTD